MLVAASIATTLLLSFVAFRIYHDRKLRRLYASSSADAVAAYYRVVFRWFPGGRYGYPTFGAIAYALFGESSKAKALLKTVPGWDHVTPIVLASRWTAEAVCAFTERDVGAGEHAIAELQKVPLRGAQAQLNQRVVVLLGRAHSVRLSDSELDELFLAFEKANFVYCLVALWAIVEALARRDDDARLSEVIAMAREYYPYCKTISRAADTRLGDALQ